MTIYTARLDLAGALRAPTPRSGDGEPDAPSGRGDGSGGAGAEGEAAGPAGPSTADDAS